MGHYLLIRRKDDAYIRNSMHAIYIWRQAPHVYNWVYIFEQKCHNIYYFRLTCMPLETIFINMYACMKGNMMNMFILFL